jgi:hypothetical protein
MTVQRRSILTGIGASAVGLAIPGVGTQAQTGLRVRREISDLEKYYPQELDRLARAIKAMTISKAGTTAWEQNATIHANRCGVPSGEIHYTYNFYPWHRGFLWMTEQNLQFALGDAQVTLPYWHWPVVGGVPKSFQKGDLSHPRGRLTLDASEYDYQKALTDGQTFLGAYKVVGGRAEITKIAFGGYDKRVVSTSALEATPHGSVHNGIGDDMGNLKWSPRDPIFYGHHCNLDRMWEIWRGAPNSPQRKSEPWSDTNFANQAFDYFDLKTGATRTITMAQIKETSTLGYRYAAVGEGPSGAPSVPVVGAPPPGGLKAPNAALLGAPVARGDASITAPSLPVAGGPPPKTRAILTIQDVALPAGQGVTVAVYLADRTMKTFSPARAVFVGTVGLVRQGADGKVSLALDVSDGLRKTRIQAGHVSVVLVPLRSKGAPLQVGGYKINVVPESQ